MNDIYTDFENFQKDLKIREKKLKDVIYFKSNNKLDSIISDLKNKEVIL